MKTNVLKTCCHLFYLLLFIYSSLLYAQPNSLATSVKNSKLIVLGTVINIQSQWDKDKRNIWTYITIDVKQYLKGSGEKKN